MRRSPYSFRLRAEGFKAQAGFEHVNQVTDQSAGRALRQWERRLCRAPWRAVISRPCGQRGTARALCRPGTRWHCRRVASGISLPFVSEDRGASFQAIKTTR